MQTVMTEHDKMLNEIHSFTRTVVAIAEMQKEPVRARADAIMMAEYLFHQIVMNKMLEKCVEKATPCNN